MIDKFCFLQKISMSELVFSSLNTAVIHISPKIQDHWKRIKQLDKPKGTTSPLWFFYCSFLAPSQSKINNIWWCLHIRKDWKMALLRL